jgi:hypothetical protein
MSFEINGKLVEKFEIQNVTASFKKREFVIEKTELTGGREFTEIIKFQLTQDRCDLIEPYQLNEEINVHFNIKGRKWEKDGRVGYFTNLEVWKIEKIANTQSEMPPQHSMDDIPPEAEDDLPF